MTRSQQVFIGLLGGIMALLFSCLLPQMMNDSAAFGAFIGAAMGSFANRMILERRGIRQPFTSTLTGFLVIVLIGSLLITLLPLKLATAATGSLPFLIVVGLGLLYAVISSGIRFRRNG
ncbi:hypothetical protein [Brevibacillus fluminis]|uniref:hypothetical protein n=1 Tax=Brevibacillus fluminis TaxID=511487 RepID=UPI0016065098|nr:hypothetical protein [Brevibacillus fluminis]